MVLEPVPFDDYRMIYAYKEACGIKAAIVPEEGFATDAFERFAEAEDTVQFVFDGKLLPGHPLVPSLFAKYADRLGRGLGFVNYVRPVIGVITSSACKPSDFTWAKIARLRFDSSDNNGSGEYQ